MGSEIIACEISDTGSRYRPASGHELKLVPMWKRVATLMVLLLLAGAVANQIFSSPDHSDMQSQRLRAQLDFMTDDIEQFEQDTGALPRSLEDLLVEPDDGAGPYAKPKTLLDPWGYPIQYRRLASPHRFVVFSLGQDGMLGGNGNALDRQATGLANGD
jgi:general secretion pathway protein G